MEHSCLQAPSFGWEEAPSIAGEELARVLGHTKLGTPGRWGLATDTLLWSLGENVPPALLRGTGPSTSGKSPGSPPTLWPSSDPSAPRPSSLSWA